MKWRAISYCENVASQLAGYREAIFVDKSAIDFLIFLLFFNKKFPIFPIFSIPSFLFSYFVEHMPLDTLTKLFCVYAQSSQSLKIGIDLSIDKSVNLIRLILIVSIHQKSEIDGTLALFIDLSRFCRLHQFLSENTSVLLFIQR